MKTALISAIELNGLMGDPALRVLDASYHLPDNGLRIAGAVDFDIDDVADPHAPLAHTLPNAELFAEKVGRLGVSNDNKVVVYDRGGMHMSAARAWWMFRVFGHDNVWLLNGGLPAWNAAGFDMEPQHGPLPPAIYKAVYKAELVKSGQQILDNTATAQFTVIDARDALRYSGDVPEPRPGMEAGHIPGSYNLPFVQLIDRSNGLLKSPEEITELFKQAGINTKEKPIAVSCGSGVTACVVALALHELGIDNAAIYDGSWSEWGANKLTPKKKGTQP